MWIVFNIFVIFYGLFILLLVDDYKINIIYFHEYAALNQTIQWKE